MTFVPKQSNSRSSPLSTSLNFTEESKVQDGITKRVKVSLGARGGVGGSGGDQTTERREAWASPEGKGNEKGRWGWR